MEIFPRRLSLFSPLWLFPLPTISSSCGRSEIGAWKRDSCRSIFSIAGNAMVPHPILFSRAFYIPGRQLLLICRGRPRCSKSHLFFCAPSFRFGRVSYFAVRPPPLFEKRETVLVIALKYQETTAPPNEISSPLRAAYCFPP